MGYGSGIVIVCIWDRSVGWLSDIYFTRGFVDTV